MTALTSAERDAAFHLIDLALHEDLDDVGDLTCRALIPPDVIGTAVFVARAEGVISGLPVLALVIENAAPAVTLTLTANDGDRTRPGTELATLTGPMASILPVERTALNFLHRLGGVATLTAKFVDAIAGSKARILDTRKTTPGWRLLEKYAVRCGGGTNHRMGLFDAVMIKDNHLAALSGEPETIAGAVRKARAAVPPGTPVVVEVDRLDQLPHALAGGTDVVLLDNMTPDQLRAAVRTRDGSAPGVLLEASGGVNLDTVRAIADSGIDRISVGALTHSAVALDVGLDYRS